MNEGAEKPGELKVGAVVAERYQILESIASGANGDVFKVRHLDFGTDLAIKTLRCNLKENTESIARLHREAQALGSVRHPNVVRVVSVAKDESIGLILVMELVEGQPLSKKIHSQGKLSLTETIRIMTGICIAVDAIHEQGILHRDLKPSNIMLATDGVLERPVLIDFGLVKQKSSQQRLTSTNAVLGTPLYMSPEQGRSEELDARTDIYSLGCVLYEMLSGSPPFQGNTVFELMMQHLNEEPAEVKLIEERPEVTDQVNSVIAKAMAKDPQARFQSGAELLSALQQCSSGEFDNSGVYKARPRIKTWSALTNLIVPATGAALILAAVAEFVMKSHSNKRVDMTLPGQVTAPQYSEKSHQEVNLAAHDVAVARHALEQARADERDSMLQVKAWSKYIDALVDHGNDSEVRNESAKARKFAGNEKERHYIDLSESKMYHVQGDYKRVVELLSPYIGNENISQPNSTFQRLGEALINEGRPDQAKECVELAHSKTTEWHNKLNARILMARALVAQQKYDEANELLIEIANHPERKQEAVKQDRLFALLAITHQHLNQLELAKDYAKQALALVNNKAVRGSVAHKRRLRQDQREIKDSLQKVGLAS